MSYRFLKRGDPWLFFEEDLLLKKPVFVLVGSYTGESEEELVSLYRKAKIVVYEASKKNFVRLSYQTRSLPLSLHNKAVTGYDGEAIFYEYGKPSAHSHVRRRSGVSNQYTVECVSVRTLLEENLINHIDVMLMTIRGPESVLLDLLDREEIKQVCFHWYDDFPEIKEKTYSRLEKKFKIIESPKEGTYACTLLIRGEKDGRE